MCSANSAKPTDIPLPIAVLRPVREAIEGSRPDLGDPHRAGMDRAGASRALTVVAPAAGIIRPISPHWLRRRPFCTTGLVVGIGIRDTPYAVRHADPCTTLRYDMVPTYCHAAPAVDAYLAGMSTG